MNPRYQLWLQAEQPKEPKNHHYIGWIASKWREWERLNGLQPYCGKTPEMHRQFDIWLKESVTNA